MTKEYFLMYDKTGAQLFVKSGWVPIVNNCNGYIVTNIGLDIVTIDDHVLYPGVPGMSNGDTLVVGGNRGEIFRGSIKIAFAGGNINQQVTIDQKYYKLGDLVIQ